MANTIICAQDLRNLSEVRYSNRRKDLPAGCKYVMALERTGDRKQYASIIVAEDCREYIEKLIADYRMKKDEPFSRADTLPEAYMYATEVAEAFINTVDAGNLRYVPQSEFDKILMPEGGEISSRVVTLATAIATYAQPSKGDSRGNGGTHSGAKKASSGGAKKASSGNWREFVSVENLGQQLVSQYTKVIAMTQKEYKPGTMADALNGVVVSGVTPTGSQEIVGDKYRPWLKCAECTAVIPGSLYVLSFVPGENPVIGEKSAEALKIKPLADKAEFDKKVLSEAKKSYEDARAKAKAEYEAALKVISGQELTDKKVAAAEKKAKEATEKLAEAEKAFAAKFAPAVTTPAPAATK